MKPNYISVLFSKHKKHLPKKLENTPLGEFLRYGFMIFASAWILQGMRIMNWRETVVKLSIDVLLVGIAISLGIHWLLAVIIAHTLNFMFNGQFHAMFTHMGATGCSARYFLEQTEWIADSIAGQPFLDAGIAYGSLSRGCYKRTSDIDLRLIPAHGGVNWWKCVIYAVALRAVAFCRRYPLDMYVYAAEVVVRRMRTDELPIMLFERNESMRDRYPERVSRVEFVQVFTQNNLTTKKTRPS